MQDDIVWLEEMIALHEIDAQWFLPFTVYRLNQLTDQREIELRITLEEPFSKSQTHRLRLRWQADTPALHNPPVQEEVITEWAACGLTCVVLPLYTTYHIVDVADRKDSFDYWVGDGTDLIGLEVSGLLAGDIHARKREKVAQLLASWRDVNGFVCVVNFTKQRVHLSFHLREQTV